ncbi:MAG: penicillin-binding protein 2 [Sulfuriflexus sp.]|nr:penicillin-binding protein 2 [Sulfuriflexus sp.]
MLRNLQIKDHGNETRLFKRRAIVAISVVIIMMLGIVARLIYLQIYSHQHYSTLSQKNRLKIVPLPPTRGLIYDRNGLLLAKNIPSFSLELIPEQVKDIDKTLERLGQFISIRDSDRAHFKRLVKQKRRFQSIPLRYRLTEEEVARFSVNRHLYKGVSIQARLIRYYPFGKEGVHTIGYVGRIDARELQRIDTANYSATTHIGKLGIERSYEDELHGQVGYQQEEVNAQNRTLRILDSTPPIAGKNLHLNIDIKLQAYADKVLGDYRGSIVAIDPRNGALLAMVSKPNYDPNPFVTGISVKNYSVLRDSPDKPLFNRTILGQYPPGSTVKPFIGLAGLDAGLANNSLFCPGWFELEGDERRYRDWKKHGHGETNLDKAIVQSCDVFFYELAKNLRITQMHKFMTQFGFGQKTGIDIIGELAGLFPSREWKRHKRGQAWFPGETVITGIGQGFTLTTPLQLASATATLAMNGLRFKPSIVQSMQGNENVEPVQQLATRYKSVLLKEPQNWQRVKRSMMRVMHSARGTARGSGRGAAYKIAGKTGTAQVFGIAQDAEYNEEEIDLRLRDHSLFVGFAPFEKPTIAIAVIAENGGSGGHIAAPIARKVLDAYLVGTEL